jgi:hypothetical protein
MIADFKGHHFVEDSKPEEWPMRHHCERCSLNAELKPDGSTDFRDERGTLVGISGIRPMSECPYRPANRSTVRRPAWSALVHESQFIVQKMKIYVLSGRLHIG